MELDSKQSKLTEVENELKDSNQKLREKEKEVNILNSKLNEMKRTIRAQLLPPLEDDLDRSKGRIGAHTTKK